MREAECCDQASNTTTEKKKEKCPIGIIITLNPSLNYSENGQKRERSLSSGDQISKRESGTSGARGGRRSVFAESPLGGGAKNVREGGCGIAGGKKKKRFRRGQERKKPLPFGKHWTNPEQYTKRGENTKGGEGRQPAKREKGLGANKKAP